MLDNHQCAIINYMAKLLLLFILIPAVELALLIEVGRHIGTLPTLALIAITGVLGAFLARSQGLGVWRHIKADVAAGRLPAGSVVDGVIILLAGAVLITPGFLTDALGFLCLVPTFRRFIKRTLWHRLKLAVQEGRVHVSMHFDAQRSPYHGDQADQREESPDSSRSLPKPRT